jgi:hypothetical protein
MPCIYITTNLLHKSLGINPWRYIGSDQRDRPVYYGSSRKLVEDIKRLGKGNFVKEIIVDYASIDNKSLREEESTILKENNVRYDESFYNIIDQYLPGGGKKGMKHRKKYTRSEAWIKSVTGKKRSEHARLKMSQKKLGTKHSLETKQQMGRSNSRYCLGKTGTEHPVSGYKHTKEECMRRSQAHKERWETSEFREKVLKKITKFWLLRDPEGNEFIIKGLRAWCKTNNIPYVVIRYNRRGWTCQQIT